LNLSFSACELINFLFLECGGLPPLCYRLRAIEYQSGVGPPHSKELLPQTNAI